MTDQPTWTRRRFLGATAVGAAGLALAACSNLDQASTPAHDSTSPPGGFTGDLLDPPIAKPDITLVDQDGKPFPFRASTAGKLTILYFGYTHCPDQCPVIMSTLAQAVNGVGTGPGSAPQVIFVGVDVKRDTPARLKSWLGGINHTFIGVTSTEAKLDQMLADVDFGPISVGKPDKNGDYEVAHYNRLLAFTPDNEAHRIYDWTVTQQQLAKDLPRLAKGQYR